MTQFQRLALSDLNPPVSSLDMQSRKDYRQSRVSLRQWAIFHAVIDYGSYASAAEHLHLSQSAVSYSIGKLQERLGMSLLRLEGRKAQITSEGGALVRRTRMLVREALDVEEYAATLKRTTGSELRLVVDMHFPSPLLMQALRSCTMQSQRINIRLMEASRSEIERALTDRTTDLAISGYVPHGFEGDPLFELEYVPVAHPNHSLFNLGRELTQADLEKEVQVIMTASEDPGYILGKLRGLINARHWAVSNFDTAVGALCEGLGYGWLPRHRIQRSLDRNKLKILPLRELSSYKVCLYLIYARSKTAGSPAANFADILHQVTSRSSFNNECVRVPR